MTAVPAAATSGTISAAVPWGSARNTASTSDGAAASIAWPVVARCGCVAPIGSCAPAAGGQRDDVDERVPVEEPDQLGADVPGRADDPDADAELGARPAVRLDRRTRLETRAHGRAEPFAEGCLWPGPGIGWTACMDA